MAWQLLSREQDYIYERPALTHRKRRQLELAAGAPQALKPPRQPRTGDARHPRTMGDERQAALHVEERYRATVANWKP